MDVPLFNNMSGVFTHPVSIDDNRMLLGALVDVVLSVAAFVVGVLVIGRLAADGPIPAWEAAVAMLAC